MCVRNSIFYIIISSAFFCVKFRLGHYYKLIFKFYSFASDAQGSKPVLRHVNFALGLMANREIRINSSNF